MSKIDIAIPFNDIEFKTRSCGFIKKSFKGKALSYVDQIVAFKRSINKNWQSFNGDVYALHSEPLNIRQAERLKAHGVIPKRIPCVERHGSKILNKITAYDNFNDADFTIQADADLLVLKEPNFDLSFDVLAGYESTINKTLVPLWKYLFDYYKLPFPNIDFFSYKHYQETGVKNFLPSINNGCIMVSNSYKPTFQKHVLEAETLIAESEYIELPTAKHYFMQIAASIAFHRCNNKSYFNKGINHLGTVEGNIHRIPYHKDISIYHYVGRQTQEVEDMFGEYFQ